ncbi:hypothetical protein [Fibrella forsythiae]|uniref:Uncharacterized protein n=1 Tax=Fibrella forsythiae TaxID=2817061 RepID=A0ABS3JBI3_9BACT|nr:hypothetical protein [Fibrella forsythiae]MBO0947346.1 hypothetical protein [Fibrella forsythiae]
MHILLYILIASLLVAAMTFYYWLTAPQYSEDGTPITTILEATDFPERNMKLAEHQPEYKTLPALYLREPYGQFITCWALTPWQRVRLLRTGKLWASQLTWKDQFQPITFTTDSRDLFIPVRPIDDLVD